MNMDVRLGHKNLEGKKLMKTSCLSNKRIGIVAVVLLLWCVPVEQIQEQATAQSPTPKGSVAIVANVGGEALLNSIEEASSSKPIALQGTLVYGDRITTRQNSVLSMLVGEDALICMDELSEISIEQDANEGRLIQLVNGRACISTIGEKGADIDLTVQTPAATLRPSPGTLFSVEVSSPAKDGEQHTLAPRAILTRLSKEDAPFAPTRVSHKPQPKTEIIQVMQGSVEVVSQIPGVQPVVVLEGFQVTVRRGIIGQLVKDTAVQCQIQDLQRSPQHTNNSEENQALVSEQLSAQATYLVAALFNSPDQPNADLVNTNKKGIILPDTLDAGLNNDGTISSPVLSELGDPSQATLPRASRLTTLDAGGTIANRQGAIATTDLVQIVGPGAVEINTSTLTLSNSQVTSSNGTNGLTLVSVTSGGLLRGTSTDPVIDITNSQTTTQSAVNVSGGVLPDLSLIEASAPLIAALSTDPSTFVSSLTTNEAIQIDGAQLVASIPADALIQLNGSTLSAIGAVISLTNGGVLAINGDLISLSNGGSLMAGSLVELSGMSTFALAGGSLINSIGSNTVDITNTLCAGGGCTGGFIFSPGTNNNITVAPGFAPTQGVTVPTGAALIVVNGDGNTVNLQ